MSKEKKKKHKHEWVSIGATINNRFFITEWECECGAKKTETIDETPLLNIKE